MPFYEVALTSVIVQSVRSNDRSRHFRSSSIEKTRFPILFMRLNERFFSCPVIKLGDDSIESRDTAAQARSAVHCHATPRHATPRRRRMCPRGACTPAFVVSPWRRICRHGTRRGAVRWARARVPPPSSCVSTLVSTRLWCVSCVSFLDVSMPSSRKQSRNARPCDAMPCVGVGASSRPSPVISHDMACRGMTYIDVCTSSCPSPVT